MTVKANVSLSNLAYVIIYVKDTEKSVPFYRDLLGIKVKMQHPGWVELETGHTILALHGEEKPSVARGQGQPIMVFHVEKIHETFEALKANGVKFDAEPRQVCEEGDSAGLSADFKDPDGNLLSIFGFVPKK
jgi:lactoylglutathione lyase